MHLYNAWLPPPVAEETKKEAEAFASVVQSVKDTWAGPHDPDSVYATLKWISVIDLFIKAKSELSSENVQELVELGLEVFHASQNKLHAQVRWGGVIVRLLKKHGKKLSLSTKWRPFYETLMHTHFKRNTGPEGWKLRQRHFETVTSLIRSCRKFFHEGSASEIWSEFRPLMENPWHNATFEGCGFLNLFLPVNSKNQDFFTSDRIAECLDLWDSIPNCQFWDIQWTSIISRCIKSCNLIDWEGFLPTLFTRVLNMFEVPVSTGTGSYPFPMEAPKNMKFLFSSKSVTPAKAIAKSIVYLLKPDGTAQLYFERLINLLEQYYHPSNGGRWTYTLERFLRYLVIYFQKRLQREQLSSGKLMNSKPCLGKEERASFVRVLLKLIDRGQYSKNDSLAETVSAATSVLAYIEPSLVLPHITMKFHLALETMTATHQLKNAVASVAYAGRPLLLTSLSGGIQSDDSYSTDTYLDLIFTSLSNALLGMDANDPPKTVATMQLIGSIFSNLATVGGSVDGPAFLQSNHLSDWLDEFFVRLFSLLQNLESNSIIHEGAQTSLLSGTFLAQESPYYYCMLEVLLGKLSKPLFSQSLKKISKFVDTNILPGATAEVGLLCCACVHSDPEEAGLHLINLILKKIILSLNGTPVTGYVEGAASSSTAPSKATLSPALETSVEYHLRVLAITVSYAGPVLLNYRDDYKQAIVSAFQAPSWKVNSAGENVLRSLLASLISYYPLDQYRPSSSQIGATVLERWGCAKADPDEKREELNPPKWHIPNQEEVSFANELLEFHLISPLENLQNICQTETRSEAGDKKELLKVTLLRIYSSLHGVMSCLPDIRPTLNCESSKKVETSCFFIAGSSGSTVGTAEMREKAAEVIHATCRYLLKERTDDSILLILVIRLMDALGNHGSLEFDEWLNHIHAWKLESAAIVESSCNFITCSHSPGKKRPRWALVDRAYLHNTWRSSQSAYHKYRNNGNISPSEHTVLLVDDLLELSLHNYETVRGYAVRTLMKVLKRWPSLVSKCVLTLTSHLLDPKAPEHLIIGSCNILGTKTVLKHLTTDAVSFTSFVKGILASSHHESLKAQKAITELFVKYNIHFSGISSSFFRNSGGQLDRPEFGELVSQITSLSFDTNGLHWRYNLMANRILLLLILSSKSESNLYSKILGETAAHYLRNLKSQLPHSRMLAISALNTLLQGSSGKSKPDMPSVESTLTHILQEEGFLSETLNSLSHVHIISDTDSSASKGSQGASSFQSGADKAMTFFYFDFSASWPRTPSWISLVTGGNFYSSFARIFKRLVQECGTPLVHSLRVSLEELLSSKERSKQCVAAEAMAGMLHSDVSGILEEWDSWMMSCLDKVVTTPSVESVPEWAACVRYAVTGKGKHGTRVPALRQKVLDCLAAPVPDTVATSVVAKRYSFLSFCLIEISAVRMGPTELQFHVKMLEELLENMSHSSAQVREAIGVALSVTCSNMRLFKTSESLREVTGDTVMSEPTAGAYENWAKLIIEKAHELSNNIQNTNQSNKMDSTLESAQEIGLKDTETEDAKTMEAIFHFAVASLKSGRSSVLLDVLVGLINPILCLQETSNKDLSTLAKATFELFKWRILRRPFLQDAVSLILSSVQDPNWRTRSASLRYIQTFMYRHTFTLSNTEKSKIWEGVEKLLVDNQVEVREHAAGVLASLMKGGDEELSRAFRDRSYTEAEKILAKRKQRKSASGLSIVTVHGTVLALTASVLSVPYDMPQWLPDHVTLLARFVSQPSPVKSTVTKAVAEFRRTHADTWSMQKDAFSEEQLEVLADTSSSSSYFA